MGYVVTVTRTDLETGKAFFCETEEEGVQKIKTLYLAAVNSTQPLDEENTYLSKTLNYAQVCDYVKVKEFRLLPVA